MSGGGRWSGERTCGAPRYSTPEEGTWLKAMTSTLGATTGLWSAGVDEPVKCTAIEAYTARARKHHAREPALATEPVECIETDAQVTGGLGSVQEPDIGWQGLASAALQVSAQPPESSAQESAHGPRGATWWAAFMRTWRNWPAD